MIFRRNLWFLKDNFVQEVVLSLLGTEYCFSIVLMNACKIKTFDNQMRLILAQMTKIWFFFKFNSLKGCVFIILVQFSKTSNMYF